MADDLDSVPDLLPEQFEHAGRKGNRLAAVAEPLFEWIQPVGAAAVKLDSGDCVHFSEKLLRRCRNGRCGSRRRVVGAWRFLVVFRGCWLAKPTIIMCALTVEPCPTATASAVGRTEIARHATGRGRMHAIDRPTDPTTEITGDNNMKPRRTSSLAAAVLSAAMLIFSGGQTAAQELTLRFALITAETFPYMDGATRFKELVEERSGGDIQVNIYPGGQLGAEREINEAILEGSIQIGVGAGAMANLAPIYNIVQVPFLIQGQDHMTAIATGEVGETLAQKIEEQAGFRVLAWFSTGDSPIETVDRPVHEPADLEGVKIRVIETPVLVDAMRALGANPTPMPYTEVYTGLKQGVIEGAHLDVLSVDTLKIYEVAKYMTDWEQITFLSEPRPVIMSASYFDSLTPEQQTLIRESMQEAAEYERQVFADKMATIRDKLVAEGVEITEVDAQAFVDKVKPVWQTYAEQLNAEDLLQDILALQQ